MSAPSGTFPAELQARYVPLGHLGQGTMGSVVKCRDRRTGRLVAIKLLHLGDHAELRARFQREARTLASVSAPQLVKVFDWGELTGGEPYLVMEYLSGRSLAKRPPSGDPLPTMLEVAAALEALHEHQLVHRDVKPANILATDEGRTVLVDLGLVHDPGAETLTRTGQIAGSLGYLPPESLQAGRTLPASDWYAWGVTLYELLEGRLPYSQETLYQVAAGGALPPPEFERLDPGSELAGILRCAMDPDPDRRLPAGGATADLDGLPARAAPGASVPAAALPAADTQPLPAQERGSDAGHPRPPGRAGLVVAGVLGLAAASWFGRRAPLPPPPPPPSPLGAAAQARASSGLELTSSEASQELRRAAQAALTQADLPRPSAWMSLGWYWFEPHFHDRRQAYEALVDPGSRRAPAFQAWAQAAQRWVTSLRDWERDQPRGTSCFDVERVRRRFGAEVLQPAFELTADLRMASLQAVARTLGGLPDQGLGVVDKAVESSRAAAQNLRFELDGWGEPQALPATVLDVAISQGFDLEAPDLAAQVDRLERAYRQAGDDPLAPWVRRSLYLVLARQAEVRALPFPRRVALYRFLRRRPATVPPERGRMERLYALRSVLAASRLLLARDLQGDGADLLQDVHDWLDENPRPPVRGAGMDTRLLQTIDLALRTRALPGYSDGPPGPGFPALVTRVGQTLDAWRESLGLARLQRK